MFFTLFPWFPLYSINRPVKLTCKFKLSLSFLLCNSRTVCIKIYLIPLWHKHSSHWDLWGKKGHRNRMPQSERKCVPWIMSTNNFQWDCHCRGQKDILWSFSSKRFISHCIYGTGENTYKEGQVSTKKENYYSEGINSILHTVQSHGMKDRNMQFSYVFRG